MVTYNVRKLNENSFSFLNNKICDEFIHIWIGFLFIVKLKVKFQPMNLQTSSGNFKRLIFSTLRCRSRNQVSNALNRRSLSLILILAHFLTYTHFHDRKNARNFSHSAYFKIRQTKIQLFK